MQSVSIEQALLASSQKIEPVDARMLLQHVLNMPQAYLHTHPEQTITSSQSQSFEQLVARRVTGEPIAYLVGAREFYDLTFKVSPAVLIPRPETELLVDLALERVPNDQHCRVLDLGTGSGAIAITIAKHRPLTTVIAVDVSVDAVAIASTNAKEIGVTNLKVIHGSWFDVMQGVQFDLIVSNPPYVAEDDPHLKQGDLRFEPPLALMAKGNGLACLQTISAAAPAHLNAGGWLLMEHGYDQAAACIKLLQQAGFKSTFSAPDLAGIMRVSGGQIENSI
ncbi:MAG: peptide chain release factor N(5)-glutamine methyltransferase [Nitrosomonas sp.]|nr:peptide chain release factor N(5)-glutamine methyltransferase [Nitrosomonas sp.]